MVLNVEEKTPELGVGRRGKEISEGEKTNTEKPYRGFVRPWKKPEGGKMINNTKLGRDKVYI